MKRWKDIFRGGCILIAGMVGIIQHANAQNYQWAKATPSTGITSSKIVKSPTGHIYTAAKFIDYAGIDLDYSPLAADTLMVYGTGAYIARYSDMGNISWGGALSGGSVNTLVSLQTDDSGNVYIAGEFTGEVDFDLSPLAADTNIVRSVFLSNSYRKCAYVAKYDSSGFLKWSIPLLGWMPVVYDMKVSNGNVYITGAIRSYASGGNFKDVDFNPSLAPQDTFYLRGDATSANNVENPFFAVYDLNGNLKTAKRLYGTPAFQGLAIETDTQKNIYLAGSLRGKHDLNPSQAAADTFFLESPRGHFLAQYDSIGLFQWAQPVVAHDSLSGLSPMLVQMNGTEVYVSGIFKGTIDFNPGSGILNLTASAGSASALPQSSYIARYSTSGSFINASSIGGLGITDQITALENDDSGFVYIGGNFIGAADFNVQTATADTFILRSAGSNDNPDFFYAKYKNDTLVWAKKIGNVDGQTLSGMAVGNKTINIVGNFTGDVIFDPNPPANLASKIDGGGTYLATYRMYPPSSAKDLITYGFTTPSATATITSADSVLVDVPFGTNVTALVADFTVSPDAIAHIGTTPQVSSTTPNDFTSILTYTIMAEDSSTKDYYVRVNVLADTTTGINDVNGTITSFNVWPNPTDAVLNFENATDVRLYDLNGRVLKEAKRTKILFISDLPVGVYIIENEHGQKRKIALSK